MKTSGRFGIWGRSGGIQCEILWHLDFIGLGVGVFRKDEYGHRGLFVNLVFINVLVFKVYE